MKSIVGYVMFTNVKNLPLTNKKTKKGISSWLLFCFVLFCTQIITVQLVFPLWEATSLLL